MGYSALEPNQKMVNCKNMNEDSKGGGMWFSAHFLSSYEYCTLSYLFCV